MHQKKVSNNIMGHVLTFTGQCFTACLLIAIGLSSYGCKDTVSVSEDVQVPLSSLTITPGTLQPAFFSNTTNYTVDVSTSVTSVTVTAAPKDSTTTMTINEIPTAAGQGRSVPLSPSEPTTNIIIVLTNQNGIESSYDIVVRKVDNTLSALTVTPPGTFPPPGFTPSTLSYQVDVGSSVPSVTVSATKLDQRAVMSGAVNAGAGVATGTATITLNEPGLPTEISITVAVPNSDAKTYTITVHRAALSGDNNLSVLTVTPGSLTPAFDSGQLTYTVSVATDVTEVTVTATKSDPNAVISGSLPNEGQKTIQLGGAGTDTPVSIIVTAPNGSSQTYTITVNRAASNDNNLSALSLTAGSVPLVLNPPFDRDHLDYTVEVPIEVIAVTVIATKSDPNAVLSGSVADPGQGQATGQATITFILLPPPPPPQISITVMAPNGVPKTYTVTVNQVLGPPPSP